MMLRWFVALWYVLFLYFDPVKSSRLISLLLSVFLFLYSCFLSAFPILQIFLLFSLIVRDCSSLPAGREKKRPRIARDAAALRLASDVTARKVNFAYVYISVFISFHGAGI